MVGGNGEYKVRQQQVKVRFTREAIDLFGHNYHCCLDSVYTAKGWIALRTVNRNGFTVPSPKSIVPKQYMRKQKTKYIKPMVSRGLPSGFKDVIVETSIGYRELQRMLNVIGIKVR